MFGKLKDSEHWPSATWTPLTVQRASPPASSTELSGQTQVLPTHNSPPLGLFHTPLPIAEMFSFLLPAFQIPPELIWILPLKSFWPFYTENSSLTSFMKPLWTAHGTACLHHESCMHLAHLESWELQFGHLLPSQNIVYSRLHLQHPVST